MDQDIWERKYHLALERMERDERDFRDLEEGLRRLSLRLSALARGQGKGVDPLLDRLNALLRSSPSRAELDPLLDQLATAVAVLDEPAMPTETLMASLGAPTDDAPEVDGTGAAAAWTSAGTGAGGGEERATVDALRTDIARLQGLLTAVSQRLGDMTRYLVAELETAGDTGHRDIDATVREEMRVLGESTLHATDLGVLQAEVNARLSIIDRHFRDYRVREDARMATYRDKAERMRDRVAELETQATSLQDSLRREHELALTDPLTGLPNRLAYERRIAQIERDVRAGGDAVCIAAFDIDHFKVINDTFGHAAGDAVLRIVGKVLARELPEPAFVARYGGEEFIVVFVGQGPEAAASAANALCATVAELAFHASSKPVTVTMSGGLTCFSPDDTAATVFDRADRALYTAKRSGRNRCVIA